MCISKIKINKTTNFGCLPFQLLSLKRYREIERGQEKKEGELEREIERERTREKERQTDR